MPLQNKAELGQWNIECTFCEGVYKQRDIERDPNTGLLVCFRCVKPYDKRRDRKPIPVEDPGKISPVQGPDLPDFDYSDIQGY